MIDKALAIVRDYIDNHFDRADYALFVIWQSTVLQHFKCMITATIAFGMCFDLTYDGDHECWYLNVYQKTAQQVISHDRIQQQPDS